MPTTEAQRFAVVCASRDFEAMRLRWRRLLLGCSPHHHHTDRFSWDDGLPLQVAHPHRVQPIADALDRRARAGNGDWAEALPDKVLTCNAPAIVLALQLWDAPIPEAEPVPAQQPASEGYVCLFGTGSTRLEALLAGLRPKEEEPPAEDTAPPLQVVKPTEPQLSAAVVFAPRSRQTDMVGCHLRKPCVMIAAPPRRAR